jgi:hypothetical protein
MERSRVLECEALRIRPINATRIAVPFDRPDFEPKHDVFHRVASIQNRACGGGSLPIAHKERYVWYGWTLAAGLATSCTLEIAAGRKLRAFYKLAIKLE